MHGSSSVPQDLLAEIREFGGDMKETYGVPVEEIQEGIKHGVRKVNIDTDIRLAMTGRCAVPCRESVEFDPRDSEACDSSRQADLRGALPAIRQRRHGLQDQGSADGKDGVALQGRRPEADRQYVGGCSHLWVRRGHHAALLLLPRCEHRDDGGGHGSRGKPSECLQPSRHGESAHHLGIIGKQHHDDHDRHGNDADHRRPEQRANGIDGRKVQCYATPKVASAMIA